MGSIKESLRKITPLRASSYEKGRKSLEKRLDTLRKDTLSNQAEARAIRSEVTSASQLVSELVATADARNAIVSESIERTLADSIVQLGHLGTQLQAIDSRLDALEQTVSEANGKLAETLALLDKLDDIDGKIQRTYHEAVTARKAGQEAVFAETFEQSIAGCPWLEGASFSPGRWAVGYPYLYVLFRALRSLEPSCILDIGLGQTSNLIGRYAQAHEGVEHLVIEHDAEWLRFYSSEQPLSRHTTVLQLDVQMSAYSGCDEPVRSYAGFREAVANRRFGLISIDGPLGSDMKELARIDALNLVPEILEPSFAILIDDTNRVGEQHTVKQIQAKLEEAGVEYAIGSYAGDKKMHVICSRDHAFLATL